MEEGLIIAQMTERSSFKYHGVVEGDLICLTWRWLYGYGCKTTYNTFVCGGWAVFFTHTTKQGGVRMAEALEDQVRLLVSLYRSLVVAEG